MATPTYTDAELLVEVRAAIASALANKSYSINGRSFTRQDLSQLRDMEKHYEAKIARTSGRTRPAVARFQGMG